MVEFKLKSLYVKQRKSINKEEAKADLSILRISDILQGTSTYHHFQVPANALIEIQYEEIMNKNLLRMVFQLDRKDLAIHYYKWNDHDQTYLEQPLHDDVIHSLAFQHILQSIKFLTDKHLSYIMNPLQRFKNISKNH
jgi:hypothetical protein